METLAREYAAFLRLVAERLSEGLAAARIKGYAVTVVEVSTADTHGAGIVFRRLSVLLLAAGLAVGLCGCTAPRPLRGGHALTSGPVGQSMVQGENASAATRQGQESIRIRSYTLPAGSRFEQAQVQAGAAGLPVTNVQAIVVSAPMPVTEREETRASTELGAAQKDTAREFAAKLSSLKGIVWVGVALFVFGIASFAWPPLRVVIGSVTTSAAITLGGLALMVLPTLIVGNELLILGGVTVAVGAWFLAHRHGHLRGELAASKTAPGTPKRLSVAAGS